MKRNLSNLCAICTVVLLTSGAINVLSITPPETTKQLVANAKAAVDAAHNALDAAQSAEQHKKPDAGKKYDKWLEAHEAAVAALAKARKAVGEFPEGSTKDGFTEQLNEQDAILKVLELRDETTVRGMSALAAMQGKEKEAKEALNKKFNGADDAIQKLPPSRREKLQKELDDLREKYRDLLALGAKPGKATDTYASLATPSSTARDGLRIVTFDTLQGRVIVNFPDDMRARDTISGTVVAEPKGPTEEERSKNMSLMGEQKIKIATAKKPDGTSDVNVEVRVTATPSPFTFKLPPTITPTPPLKSVSSGSSGGLGITLTNTSGSFTVGGTTTVPIEMVSLSLQSAAPLTIPQLPSIGQQGKPIVIYGPFDGNSSNTSLNWTRPRSAVQDFEKNTENVSGGFGLIDGRSIAESPRKGVFVCPPEVAGPMEITLTEGNTQTKGTYNNLGVNLTAQETNLLKGQSTELGIRVTGLQGITEPIPLHLTKGGVVTMQGGDIQTMLIKPAEVQTNGTYTTTRTITGVQTGGWNATATVVVFDVCLQDEKTGNLLRWNSTTGDYHFCNLFPTAVAGDAGRINISWYGTNTPDTGSVGWGGCTITLEHNSTDGRVKAQMDRCTQTGSATVQPASSKTTFTIIDRDTRNNTCVCGGGNDAASRPVRDSSSFEKIRVDATEIVMKSKELNNQDRQRLLAGIGSARSIPALQSLFAGVPQIVAQPKSIKVPPVPTGPPNPQPPPWAPKDGPELVKFGPWRVPVIEAINKLWMMGFTREAQKLRDMLNNGGIVFGTIGNSENDAETSAVDGHIHLSNQVLQDLEELARTLLHELFHSEHHTGWGYLANLGLQESRTLGAAQEDDRFLTRQHDLNRQFTPDGQSQMTKIEDAAKKSADYVGP